MHNDSKTPLIGKAITPNLGSKIYSLKPPLRIASGVMPSHINNDFAMRLLSMIISLVFLINKIIRRLLVYEVIEPVAVQHMRVCLPAEKRAARVVVAGEVPHRGVNLPAQIYVPVVFLCQRLAVILGVAGDEEATVVAAGHNVYARFL